MNDFILVLGFIYWLFCYAYCMSYIREVFMRKNAFVKICVLMIMMVSCVVATPFSIGSHLAGVFLRMDEE